MRLYKRIVEVIIGDDDNADSISDLFIAFEIIKETSSKPAEGWIKIYNLNESTEARIFKRGKRIRFLAGYDGIANLVFDGDVRKVEKDKSGLNRVTVITLGGNVFKTTSAEFVKSYQGPVSAKQVVKDALPSFSLISGTLSTIPDNLILNDFAWSGRTSDMLDRILRPSNIQWYEDNGVINFSSNGGVPNDAVFVLSEDSGMVGSPSFTDKGIKVVSLLNALININSKIQPVSSVLQKPASGDDKNARAQSKEGFYKVTKIVHRGDNRNGDFVSEIIAVPLDE